MSTEKSPERDEAAQAGPWHDYPVSGAPAPEIPSQQQPQWPASSSAPPHYYAPSPPPQQPAPEQPAPWSAPPWPTSGGGAAQTSGGGWGDPLLPGGLGAEPTQYQRRIVPSTPERKSRLVLGLLLGFLAGVLVAAPTAFFLAPGGSDPGPTPEPSAVASGPAQLGPFEENQLALNKQKFSGELATLAASWLPFVSNCLTKGEAGGPKPGPDEQAHVLCRYGSVFIHFAQFKGPAERDAARAYRQRLNTESRELAPGMAEPGQKPRTSDPAPGTYIEYALRTPDKRTAAGLWWDSADDKAVSIYLEAGWDPTLGKSWDPLRDLWQRHS